ncbi:MAG TPA: hypothetical protein PLV25_06395, partial [Opitutales bacterium]|nr:hypothetical protein [Opitutales bacterium]
MKRFYFRLESVLMLRDLREKQSRMALQEAIARRRSASGALSEAKREWQQLHDHIVKMRQGLYDPSIETAYFESL